MNAAVPPAMPLGRHAELLARAYAAVLFCESPWIGAWFAILTWWSPSAALAGLVGLIAAALWARLLGLDWLGQPHLVNGLLTGLFIGAFHAIEFTLFCWVVVTALFVTLSAHWLAGVLWRAGRLPVMSLPFVLACWIFLLVSLRSDASGILAPALTPQVASVFGPWLDNFFTALGWMFLIPYPLAGALLFAGLIVASRYLALLALSGYVAGQLTLRWFGLEDSNVIGFNLMLAPIALGGIFSVPGRASFVMALAGGALAGLFGVALGGLLQPALLPPLTLPFLLAVWLWLGGLGTRNSSGALRLNLDSPAMPEIAYERARLAQARGGTLAGSLPLLPPFYGEWRVSQGFDGPHTHRSPWQHALDFDIIEGGRNHRGSGTTQSEYFCFGAPLLAPSAAQVVRVQDDLPDTAPGEPDAANNWGNHLLLRTTGGMHILLAHLKQRSVTVTVGEWVAAGQRIAACGSSGRSPEPHLHLHVQSAEPLGSPTCPFHLANVLVRSDDGPREFHLAHLPSEGEMVSVAPRDERLAAALHLPPGRTMSYRIRAVEATAVCCLRTELTLLGQSRLVASSGASAAYEETPAVIGFYDRDARADPMLDLWLLALGLTPLSVSASATCWSDRPSVRLLPLGLGRRLLSALLWPLGGGCESSYRRGWDDTSHAWLQEGDHRVRLGPGLEWRATTAAWIEPNHGVRRLRLEMFGERREAELEPQAIVSTGDTVISESSIVAAEKEYNK